MIIVSPARADIPIDYEPPIKYKNWDDFKESVEKNIAVQKINGKSEVWTGGLALAAGLIGDSLAKDPLEKGVFALFQSIGIASIGLGLYDQAIGENNRNFYYLLKGNSIGLTEDQKNSMVKSYYRINKFYEDKEKKIKMYTFAIMAITQFYNGSRVENSSVKNTLFFIGAINTLVSVSYGF